MTSTLSPQVRQRQAIERRIATLVVKQLLAQGFSLSIDNGGDELELQRCTDQAQILQHLFLTDEEHLLVHRGIERTGFVYFVYGNDGWDVICDYSVDLEPWIGEGTPVQQLIDDLEAVS